jgi:Carboxypeptidase regulatory-like domain/CarboxypepD_reg-like domain
LQLGSWELSYWRLMRFIRALGFVAALSLAANGALVAQQPTAAPPAPAKTGKAAISGVVVDSLNLRYLPGADVVIEGVDATLTTDSVGRFKIDGLPPGTYQVGVFHPLLDTLGIAVASQPFHVGPDSTTIVILSVPPAATLIRRVCPPRSADQGQSAVIGHVNDPETLEPVEGAEVSIAWTEVEVSKQVGFLQTPHVLRDTTNGAGAFHLCGVPSSTEATLQARKAAAVTSEIPISLGDTDAELFARTLLLSRADSGVTVGNATVSGKVVLEGTPSTNAVSRVQLVGTNVVALTNERGEFTMTGLPSGTRVLLARHLGYGAQTVSVDLTSREPQKVTIKLPRFVAIMDPVVVTARLSAGLDRVGFNERKKRSGSGYFLGPEKIRDMHAIYLTDILRNLPTLHFTYSGGNISRITSRRGSSGMSDRSCVQYFVDDMPWSAPLASAGDINSFVNGNEVVAVELYQPGQAPPRYMRGMGTCITVVIWTRFRVPDLTEK